MKTFFSARMRLSLLLFLFLCGIGGGVLPAQQTPPALSDSVATFLIEENLDDFLGFGMVLTEKGQEDFTYTHGSPTNEQLRPFTDSTLFNLGSVSKLFTALAILKLAESQDLKLDDPIYYYFPEFLSIKGKAKKAHEITILDLLQHRSGITQSMADLYPELFGKELLKTEDEFYENTYNYRAFLTREDFKERFMMYARIDKKPRSGYNFSNLGFVILGYIVEEISGLNLGQFVTNQIFVPLEMHDSHYYVTPDSMEDRLAHGYYRLGDGSYLNVHANEVESPSPTGDGGIKTSLRDMRRFMHFLEGDLKQIDTYNKVLPREALLSMIGPLKKGPDRDTWIGLGFHNLQPYNFTGHAGGWDGFLSILYYHPETASCLFLVTNREDNELFRFLTVYAAYAVLQRQN